MIRPPGWEHAVDWKDRNREVERRRDVLERIVVLLLALAGLADRASGMPTGRRKLFAILALAEAEARAFVIGMARDCGMPIEPEMSVAHGPAVRLADSFRALALTLGAMLAAVRRFVRPLPGAGAAQAGLQMPPRRRLKSKGIRRCIALPTPDTS